MGAAGAEGKLTGDLIAGVDEAGRGALAGPLFVAAVILPVGFVHPLLRDSKVLLPAQRSWMAALIQEVALAFAIVEVSVEEIEQLNVLQATLGGMVRAVEALSLRPGVVRVDGPHAPYLPSYRVEAHIKGDARLPEIAAASILAKTARDAHLLALHQAYPHYHWASNKGYPTPQHWQALQMHGPSPHHRRSFLKKLWE